MGRLLLASLPATGSIIYCCKHCDTHLAYGTDIISRMFQCKHGKAYLVDKMVNVNVGEKENRMMTTGMHTVCDIFCVSCGSILGWKYLAAFQKTQRYKEGKFIMDRKTVLPMAATPSSSAASTLQQQHTASADDDDEESEDDDEDSSSDHQD